MSSPTAARSAVRVLVAAPDPLARSGLAALVRAAGGDVIDVAWSQSDALDAVAAHGPDLVAYALEPGDAMVDEDLRLVAAARVPVLAFADGSDAARIAWRSGAAGVLSRGATAASVGAALAAVAEGLRVGEPEAWPDLVASSDAGEGVPEALTPRETQVLALMAEGLPNKTIARRLGISENTVKFHASAVLAKLGAASRTEAAIRAARMGLIPL